MELLSINDALKQKTEWHSLGKVTTDVKFDLTEKEKIELGEIKVRSGAILQVGKRRFLKLKVK
jgi:hypothetical protein